MWYVWIISIAVFMFFLVLFEYLFFHETFKSKFLTPGLKAIFYKDSLN